MGDSDERAAARASLQFAARADHGWGRGPAARRRYLPYAGPAVRAGQPMKFYPVKKRLAGFFWCFHRDVAHVVDEVRLEPDICLAAE